VTSTSRLEARSLAHAGIAFATCVASRNTRSEGRARATESRARWRRVALDGTVEAERDRGTHVNVACREGGGRGQPPRGSWRYTACGHDDSARISLHAVRRVPRHRGLERRQARMGPWARLRDVAWHTRARTPLGGHGPRVAADGGVSRLFVGYTLVRRERSTLYVRGREHSVRRHPHARCQGQEWEEPRRGHHQPHPRRRGPLPFHREPGPERTLRPVPAGRVAPRVCRPDKASSRTRRRFTSGQGRSPSHCVCQFGAQRRALRRSSPLPILPEESWNARELRDVVGHESQAASERDGGDL
jgi:hypothetical protein